tara:strand:- start:162 stop:527 length:366 start_codon:yes stop_codon:yes gene_type:complete
MSKYFRQGFRFGSTLKAVFKGKKVESKLPDDAKIPEEIKNIYKLDKTGAKDKIIESYNKRLKKEKMKVKRAEEPSMLEDYTDLMVTDFAQKKGPFIDKRKIRQEEARKRNLEKKLKRNRNR